MAVSIILTEIACTQKWKFKLQHNKSCHWSQDCYATQRVDTNLLPFSEFLVVADNVRVVEARVVQVVQAVPQTVVTGKMKNLLLNKEIYEDDAEFCIVCV